MCEVQHDCYLIGYGCAEACVSTLLLGNSHGQTGLKDWYEFMQMILEIMHSVDGVDIALQLKFDTKHCAHNIF